MLLAATLGLALSGQGGPVVPGVALAADRSGDLYQRAPTQPPGPVQPAPTPPAGGPGIPVSRNITVTRGGQTYPTFTFETERAPDGRLMRAGSLLVTLKPGVTPARRNQVHQSAGAVEIGPVGRDSTVRVQVPRGAAAQALQIYRTSADVQSVQPNYVRTATLNPNDTQFSQQYALTKISAPAAWDRTHGSVSVKVAVLDCGIYGSSSGYVGPDGLGHRDVRDKIVLEHNFSQSPYGADDLCNHGTHVAAIAAASTNNATGIAGVGYDTSIMNIKVLEDNGSGSIDKIADGIKFAADQGAKVINLSLGGPGPCTPFEQDAIDYAWQRGALIVAAAGNDGLGQSSAPANCANVVAVAATDQSDARPFWSNYGANVDVAAPGASILSANNAGTYGTEDGTSMATPHVAGLAALIFGAKPSLSNQAVVDFLFQTADKIAGTGSLWAHGRINAEAAINAASPPPPPPPRADPIRRPASGPGPTVVPLPQPTRR